jgi:hypothetical protein
MQGTLPTIAKIDKRFFLLQKGPYWPFLFLGQRQRAGQIDVKYVTLSCPTYRLIPKPEKRSELHYLPSDICDGHRPPLQGRE